MSSVYRVVVHLFVNFHNPWLFFFLLHVQGFLISGFFPFHLFIQGQGSLFRSVKLNSLWGKLQRTFQIPSLLITFFLSLMKNSGDKSNNKKVIKHIDSPRANTVHLFSFIDVFDLLIFKDSFCFYIHKAKCCVIWGFFCFSLLILLVMSSSGRFYYQRHVSLTTLI